MSTSVNGVVKKADIDLEKKRHGSSGTQKGKHFVVLRSVSLSGLPCLEIYPCSSWPNCMRVEKTVIDVRSLVSVQRIAPRKAGKRKGFKLQISCVAETIMFICETEADQRDWEAKISSVFFAGSKPFPISIAKCADGESHAAADASLEIAKQNLVIRKNCGDGDPLLTVSLNNIESFSIASGQQDRKEVVVRIKEQAAVTELSFWSTVSGEIVSALEAQMRLLKQTSPLSPPPSNSLSTLSLAPVLSRSIGCVKSTSQEGHHSFDMARGHSVDDSAEEPPQIKLGKGPSLRRFRKFCSDSDLSTEKEDDHLGSVEGVNTIGALPSQEKGKKKPIPLPRPDKRIRRPRGITVPNSENSEHFYHSAHSDNAQPESQFGSLSPPSVAGEKTIQKGDYSYIDVWRGGTMVNQKRINPIYPAVKGNSVKSDVAKKQHRRAPAPVPRPSDTLSEHDYLSLVNFAMEDDDNDNDNDKEYIYVNRSHTPDENQNEEDVQSSSDDDYDEICEFVPEERDYESLPDDERPLIGGERVYASPHFQGSDSDSLSDEGDYEIPPHESDHEEEKDGYPTYVNVN